MSNRPAGKSRLSGSEREQCRVGFWVPAAKQKQHRESSSTYRGARSGDGHGRGLAGQGVSGEERDWAPRSRLSGREQHQPASGTRLLQGGVGEEESKLWREQGRHANVWSSRKLTNLR